MKNPDRIIGKIVEEGSQNKFTLLYIRNTQRELDMQDILKQVVVIENNICHHSYEVVLGEFLKQTKECAICSNNQESKLSTKKYS